MKRKEKLQRAAGMTLSALLLAGAVAPPAFAAKVSAYQDMSAILTLYSSKNLYRPSSIGGTYLGINSEGL